MECGPSLLKRNQIQLKSRKGNTINKLSESDLVPGPAGGGDSPVGTWPLTPDQIEIPRTELGHPKTKENPTSITQAQLDTSEIDAECTEDGPGPE
jgi:hypothetical protein